MFLLIETLLQIVTPKKIKGGTEWKKEQIRFINASQTPGIHPISLQKRLEQKEFSNRRALQKAAKDIQF